MNRDTCRWLPCIWPSSIWLPLSIIFNLRSWHIHLGQGGGNSNFISESQVKNFPVNSLRFSDAACHHGISISIQVMDSHLTESKAFAWTYAELLSMGPMGTNFSETSINMIQFASMYLKLLLLCRGFNLLMQLWGCEGGHYKVSDLEKNWYMYIKSPILPHRIALLWKLCFCYFKEKIIIHKQQWTH